VARLDNKVPKNFLIENGGGTLKNQLNKIGTTPSLHLVPFCQLPYFFDQTLWLLYSKVAFISLGSQWTANRYIRAIQLDLIDTGSSMCSLSVLAVMQLWKQVLEHKQPYQWVLAAVVSMRICAPRILTAATIRGWCLFRLEAIGVPDCVATIQVQWLFEGVSNGRNMVGLVFCHLCAQKGCLSYKQGPGEQSHQNKKKTFCLIPPIMLVVFHNPLGCLQCTAEIQSCILQSRQHQW